jgi:TusA-related sulfurtransferase
MLLGLVVLGTALGATACDEKASPAPVVVATTATAPPAAAPAPAPAAVTVGARGNMAHCPNAVDGATTGLKDVEGGIELRITAKDAAATADIRARTKAIVDASKTASVTRHDGSGGGGGPFGRCPVILRDTTIEASDVDEGSRIVVKTKSAAEIDWLRREAAERAAQLRAPGAAGAGAGKMAHCPSAVDGAETKISDTQDGVSVTVLAKGDGVKQVRDRAKALAEVSKRGTTPTADGKHSGDGRGGGALGRCPVVLKDTIVETKDVEGGAQISVKAKTAATVGMIQVDSRNRAAKFQVVALAK